MVNRFNRKMKEEMENIRPRICTLNNCRTYTIGIFGESTNQKTETESERIEEPETPRPMPLPPRILVPGIHFERFIAFVSHNTAIPMRL